MTRVLTVAFAALTVLAPLTAHAQTEQERALARDLFQRGVEAAEERRWSAAVDAFERSQRIAPRTATLFNLASALVQAERLVEARERYRSFAGRVDEGELAAEARRSIEVLDGRIARLTIDVRGLAPVDEVRLDGQPLARATLGAPLPADPTAHVVTVHRGDTELAREAITLEEGAARSVSLRVPAPDPGEPTPPDPAAPVSSDQDGGEDLAWLGVLIAVVVAGGIAAGVAGFVVVDGQTPVYEGTLGSFVLP